MRETRKQKKHKRIRQTMYESRQLSSPYLAKKLRKKEKRKRNMDEYKALERIFPLNSILTTEQDFLFFNFKKHKKKENTQEILFFFSKERRIFFI